MPFIETRDGNDLYVKDWGEDGRTVILIHGWPLVADSWDDQALALAEAGYRVLAMIGAASAARSALGRL
jgi:pimeloyl-ACP methyl ester carboxylesterase